jgi:endonuclease YncB( thermonuclease family)
MFLAGCEAAASDPASLKTATVYGDGEIVPAGERFACTPVKVYDGDGPIWCEEGPRIRLSGIAAREMDGGCRPNQPCPPASAEAARDALVRLLGSASGTDETGHRILAHAAPLACTSVGSAGGKRTAAWCVSPAQGDLSCRMVASGLVLRWERYWRDHRC